MRVPPTVFATPAVLARTLAGQIADGIELAVGEDRPYVLGCPGGRSPRGTYRALADEVRRRSLDLSGLVIAMMDDYVEAGPDGSFVPVAADLPHSCRRFARDEIVEPLTRAAGPGRGVGADHVWFPEPAAPASFDERLGAVGGIDLFLLASGGSDGHVAFNPPWSPRESRSRVVRLADSTRRDNLATFPTLRSGTGDSVDRVPTHGVTVGIDTIARHSRSAVMIVVGDEKAHALARLARATRHEPDWPATVLSECAQPGLFTDTATAALSVPEPVTS